jgi:hypothetical protein
MSNFGDDEEEFAPFVEGLDDEEDEGDDSSGSSDDSAYWAYIGQPKPVVDPIDDDSNDIELGIYDFTPTPSWGEVAPPSWGDGDSTDIYDGGSTEFLAAADDLDDDEISSIHSGLADINDLRSQVDQDEFVLTEEHLAYRKSVQDAIEANYDDRHTISTYDFDSREWIETHKVPPDSFDEYYSNPDNFRTDDTANDTAVDHDDTISGSQDYFNRQFDTSADDERQAFDPNYGTQTLESKHGILDAPRNSIGQRLTEGGDAYSDWAEKRLMRDAAELAKSESYLKRNGYI